MPESEPSAVKNLSLLPTDSRKSIKPITDPQFTLLDQYPRNLRGHLEFVEWMCDEVCDQAHAKKAQAYSNQTITQALDGIYWAQALTRVGELPSLLPEGAEVRDLLQQNENVKRILKKQLSLRTVEQLADLLKPAVQSLRDAVEEFWQRVEADTPRAELQRLLAKAQAEQETELERSERSKAESNRVHAEYKQFSSAFEGVWQFVTKADSVDWREWAKRWRNAANCMTAEMHRRLSSLPASLDVPTFQAATLMLLDSESSLEQMADQLRTLAANPRLMSFASWMPTLQNWLFPPPTIDNGSHFLELSPVAEVACASREEYAEVRAALLGYGFDIKRSNETWKSNRQTSS